MRRGVRRGPTIGAKGAPIIAIIAACIHVKPREQVGAVHRKIGVVTVGRVGPGEVGGVAKQINRADEG